MQLLETCNSCREKAECDNIKLCNRVNCFQILKKQSMYRIVSKLWGQGWLYAARVIFQRKSPYLSPIQSWFPCWELFSHLECQSWGCILSWTRNLTYFFLNKRVLPTNTNLTFTKKNAYLRFELGQCAIDRFLSLKNSSSLSRRFTPWNPVICKQ